MVYKVAIKYVVEVEADTQASAIMSSQYAGIYSEKVKDLSFRVVWEGTQELPDGKLPVPVGLKDGTSHQHVVGAEAHDLGVGTPEVEERA